MKKYFLNIYKIFVWESPRYSLLLLALAITAVFIYPYPKLAGWFGFFVAGYSAIANDSIQTIGTFISSNAKRKWWSLWLFIGTIFVFTLLYSWVNYHGDISFQRLTTKGFDKAPEKFTFFQLLAPIVLLVLTRFKVPVSTTFLLLSVFASSSSSIVSVLKKSLLGYGIAFVCALSIWIICESYFQKIYKGKASRWWVPAQWLTSGVLWGVWVMQDAANIAVFLPRALSLGEFLLATGYVFLGLGVLFYLRGDKIQEIVTEKTNVSDVRSATIIDFIYALIMIVFTYINSVPMSTTWVFIGLLGGRELGIKISCHINSFESSKKPFKLIFSDIRNALLGLFISILLAVLANDRIREELF